MSRKLCNLIFELKTRICASADMAKNDAGNGNPRMCCMPGPSGGGCICMSFTPESERRKLDTATLQPGDLVDSYTNPMSADMLVEIQCLLLSRNLRLEPSLMGWRVVGAPG